MSGPAELNPPSHPLSPLDSVKEVSLDTEKLDKRLRKLTEEVSWGGRLLRGIKESVKTLIRSIAERRWSPTDMHRNEKFHNNLEKLKGEVTDFTTLLADSRSQLESENKDHTDKFYQTDYVLNLTAADSAAKVYTLLDNLLGYSTIAKLTEENARELEKLRNEIGSVLVECYDNKNEDAKKFVEITSKKINNINDQIDLFEFDDNDQDKKELVARLKKELKEIANEIIKVRSTEEVLAFVEKACGHALQAQGNSSPGEESSTDRQKWLDLSSDYKLLIDDLKTLVIEFTYDRKDLEVYNIRDAQEKMEKRVNQPAKKAKQQQEEQERARQVEQKR